MRALIVRASILCLGLAAVVTAAVPGQPQEQSKPTVLAQPARDAVPPPTGTGVIAGTLVAADSGRPVRRARVSVASPETRFARSVSTDEQGRFSFPELPAGQFTLNVSRQGYLDVAYGQRRPGAGRPGTPIQLAAGQRLDDISLKIPRGGVITGIITDEFGDPAMGTPVRAFRYVMRSGERTLQSAGAGTTDDRGIYRIPALPPGDYIVSAAPRDSLDNLDAMKVEELKARVEGVAMAAKAGGSEALMAEAKAMAIRASEVTPGSPGEPSFGYAPVYYPGAMQASAASTVALDVSEERSGVDVQLQLVPTARVSGTLVSSDGSLPAGAEVRLVENDQPVTGMGTRTTRSMPDGSFSFSGVTPGSYALLARVAPRVQMRTSTGDGMMTFEGKVVVTVPKGDDITQLQVGEARWAQADISVDGRTLSNIVLVLQRGMSIAGTVSLESAPPQPIDLTRVRVTAVPVAPSAGAEAMSVPPAAVDANGRFTVRGVIPGRYRLNATGVPAGWTIKSAMFAGRDALDFALEIKPGEDHVGGVLTLTNRTTDLSGTLQDPSGKPIADYTIVAFAADRRYWTPQSRRTQASRPATDGRFTFRNLPAGEYRLIAVVDPEPGQWFDPAFLNQLFGASMALTLGEGERKTQDVRVAAGK